LSAIGTTGLGTFIRFVARLITVVADDGASVRFGQRCKECTKKIGIISHEGQGVVVGAGRCRIQRTGGRGRMGCMVDRGWLRRAGKFRPGAGLNSITIVAVQFIKNGEQRCFIFLAKIGDTRVLELQHRAQGVELREEVLIPSRM
jgi:hypothetical protein